MKRKRYTDEQIAYALRQAEAGTPIKQVCRKLGVSEQTLYTWRRKFAGMGVAELRELRQLRHENRKLKRLVADLSLDKRMLQEVVSKRCKAGAQTRGRPVPAGRPGLRAGSLTYAVPADESDPSDCNLIVWRPRLFGGSCDWLRSPAPHRGARATTPRSRPYCRSVPGCSTGDSGHDRVVTVATRATTSVALVRPPKEGAGSSRSLARSLRRRHPALCLDCVSTSWRRRESARRHAALRQVADSIRDEGFQLCDKIVSVDGIAPVDLIGRHRQLSFLLSR